MVTSSKLAPKKSSKLAPKKSSKLALKKSSKLALKKSSKLALKKSSKMAPKKSSKLAPKKSSKLAPKKSSKLAPKKSSKLAPKKSSKTVPKKSSKTNDLYIFNVNKKLFNDGSSPEWYIWMKPQDTSIWYRGKMKKTAQPYLDAPFFSKNNKGLVKNNIIKCPINRSGTIFTNVKVDGDDTFRNVLQKIYDFYNQPITKLDLKNEYKYIYHPTDVIGYHSISDDDYIIRAREKFAKNNKIKKFEMLGSKGLLVEHDPYTCSGLVRWGHFGRCKKDGCYTLLLES